MPVDPLLSLDHVTFEIAAEHACAQVPIASPDARAGTVLRSLEGQSYESAAHIVVCEDHRFLGIVTIEDLLAASAEAMMNDLMDKEAPVVAPGVDQEIAARRAVQHEESALAVVDSDGRFVGIIPPHRLLAVLLWEHEEDLSHLGGFIQNGAAARRASEEPVTRRFWHRLPWLLLGVGGALLATDIVSWFEAQLQGHIVLAFFVPGIVYLADAVGTQTETVVIRGLSVGVTIRRMLGRELLTGLTIGLALTLVFLPIAWWRWGQTDIVLGVSLSLFAACSTATVVAMVFPWLLDHFGYDPAFGSGPLATVIQDLLSILIYFVIVTSVLG
jgi:magnesium transporter